MKRPASWTAAHAATAATAHNCERRSPSLPRKDGGIGWGTRPRSMQPRSGWQAPRGWTQYGRAPSVSAGRLRIVACWSAQAPKATRCSWHGGRAPRHAVADGRDAQRQSGRIGKCCKGFGAEAGGQSPADFGLWFAEQGRRAAAPGIKGVRHHGRDEHSMMVAPFPLALRSEPDWSVDADAELDRMVRVHVCGRQSLPDPQTSSVPETDPADAEDAHAALR